MKEIDVARIMKIHRELIKLRKHNEKHRFDEVPKFRKCSFLIFFSPEHAEILKLIEKPHEETKNNWKIIEWQSTRSPSGNLVDGSPLACNLKFLST